MVIKLQASAKFQSSVSVKSPTIAVGNEGLRLTGIQTDSVLPVKSTLLIKRCRSPTSDMALYTSLKLFRGQTPSDMQQMRDMSQNRLHHLKTRETIVYLKRSSGSAFRHLGGQHSCITCQTPFMIIIPPSQKNRVPIRLQCCAGGAVLC
ncbi:hypothetical protein RRG08_019643 [Elysia crispata]|uniref:Uncharacterized protein n=1 Tax=Elysia crispata TaxID=231223 RepID=A0AAE1DM10_9GAST|nr:hypothetical protein RRG08_019643 [Elysia crispata]